MKVNNQMKVNSTMDRCDHSGFLGRNHLIKCVPQSSYYVMCRSEKSINGYVDIIMFPLF